MKGWVNCTKSFQGVSPPLPWHSPLLPHAQSTPTLPAGGSVKRVKRAISSSNKEHIKGHKSVNSSPVAMVGRPSWCWRVSQSYLSNINPVMRDSRALLGPPPRPPKARAIESDLYHGPGQPVWSSCWHVSFMLSSNKVSLWLLPHIGRKPTSFHDSNYPVHLETSHFLLIQPVSHVTDMARCQACV